MEGLWLNGLSGMIGGIARASVGLMKALSKRKKFKLGYFAMTVLLSGMIGLFLGLLSVGDYRTSLLAGYAGTDVLEGAYKVAKRTSESP